MGCRRASRAQLAEGARLRAALAQASAARHPRSLGPTTRSAVAAVLRTRVRELRAAQHLVLQPHRTCASTLQSKSLAWPRGMYRKHVQNRKSLRGLGNPAVHLPQWGCRVVSLALL